MSKNKKLGKCTHCMLDKILTREHVISRNLFPKGYLKKNPIIVPVCRDCNNGYSKDEEYFRNFVNALSIESSKEAGNLLFSKIKRSMQRRPAIHKKAMDSMELVNLYSKSGIYLGRKTKISISEDDWKRYHNILDKYIKGLFFHEFKTCFPEDHRMKHIFGDKNNKNHTNMLEHINKWNLDNKEVFFHGYNFIPDSFESMWASTFFNTVFFVTLVTTEEKYNQFEKESKNKK